jgi:hypothetical protein
MRHAAKIDPLIGFGLLVGIIVPGVGAYQRSEPWAFGVSIFIGLLVLGCCYPQWYETTGDALVVRAGVITYRVPYSAIISARPSTSRRSSFALSLDRIEIAYGAKSILIAPKDQQAFLADLATRAPQLYSQSRNISFASLE